MANPLGSTPGIIVGVGVGTAAAAAIEPAIELPRQDAWSKNPNRLLNPATLARLVAQGGIDLGTAQTDAVREGYSADKIDALVYLEQTVPGFAEALTLWRRNPAAFAALWTHTLVKRGLDARYLPFLDELRDDRIDPAVIATAIQRGIIADPGILPVGPPSGAGRVRPFPVFPIDALQEASDQGIDKARLSVMVGNVGLPASNDQAASAYFRGIIELNDYYRAISEGNTRNEWRDAILEQARQILTAGQYAELRLRGWLTDPEMYAGTAKHGMSPAETDLLFKVLGRPIPVHQVTTGLARGGTYNGPTTGIPEPYMRSMEEGNQRPEWYSLSYANRYTYPSAFVLRALTQAGDLTQAESHQILLDIGWRPDLAQTVSAKWATGTAAKTKSETKTELADEFETGFISEAEYRTALTGLGIIAHQQDLEVLHSAAVAVKTERGRAVTALHKLFVAHSIDDPTARADLAALGMQPEAIARILPIWTLERDAARKELTAAQVRAAYRKNLLTQAVALADLEERGLSAADAATYLAS